MKLHLHRLIAATFCLGLCVAFILHYTMMVIVRLLHSGILDYQCLIFAAIFAILGIFDYFDIKKAYKEL